MEATFAGLALLLVKHFVADFLLQTSAQVRHKGTYGHPAGLAHAGTHAVLTLPCLIVLPVAVSAAFAAAAIEFVLHYHQDWAKERLNARLASTPADQRFWIVLGGDQLLHQLTYVAMLFVLL